MTASAGYTKSGPIPEAPAKQMRSPHPLAVEVTGVCFHPAWYISEECSGAGGVGIVLQLTGKSQDRNWISDEVRLVSNKVCKVGSS